MNQEFVQENKGILQALSISVEAMCNMSCARYDDVKDRARLFNDALAIVRELIGPELRLTTMKVTCTWCQKSLGEKEGNGAVGESHGICKPCMETHLADEPLKPVKPLSLDEVRRAREDAENDVLERANERMRNSLKGIKTLTYSSAS